MRVLHLLSNNRGSVYDLVSILCYNSEFNFVCVRNNNLIKTIFLIRKASIIHLHEPVLIIFIPIIKLFFRKKIIVTLHDEGDLYMTLTMPIIKSKILQFFFNFSLLFVDRAVCVSEFIRNKYLAQIKNLNVIYNPILTKNISLCNYNMPNNNLIFVGNQYVAKGFGYIFENIKYLENYQLHFFGLRESQIPLIKKKKNIIIHPFLDRAALFNKINELKGLIIITSLSEGFGMFVAESAALGFPMLINFLPVYNEFLDINEVNFFNIKDFDSLLIALKKINSPIENKIKGNYKQSINSFKDNYLESYKLVDGK